MKTIKKEYKKILNAIKEKNQVLKYIRKNKDRTIKEIVADFNERRNNLTTEEKVVLAFLIDKKYVRVEEGELEC